METVAIVLLAVPLFAVGAGEGAKQVYMAESNVGKSHLLVQPINSGENNRNAAPKKMKDRAGTLCPSGYILLKEETWSLSAYNTLDTELFWHIKCTEQPKA